MLTLNAWFAVQKFPKGQRGSTTQDRESQHRICLLHQDRICYNERVESSQVYSLGWFANNPMCNNITSCYYGYLLQIGLPVDQIGANLCCFCSNDVGGDCSIHSPADVHYGLHLMQKTQVKQAQTHLDTEITIKKNSKVT